MLYVRESTPSLRDLGGASKWWLDKSLQTLASDIAALGGQLVLRTGEAKDIIADVLEETGAEAVYWNRRYDLAGRDVDAAIKQI